ncbi:ZIP Zinc transporter [Vibrio sp. B1FLJ16]|nr:ZIP Zinc transporter [Vibrio sp. B1FLJ16]CAE6907715.1 ZIP Zinc transporter [Vibrio sp. B1FLJ16]
MLAAKEEAHIDNLIWIVIGGFLMSAIALVGSFTVVLNPATLDRLLLPFVSLAAGTLIGGAFFHMIPEGAAALDPLVASVWVAAGFVIFLGLELFIHWHHSHSSQRTKREPVTYLILVGDAVHNFLGGLGIASTFLINPAAGIMAWVAAAAHEVPQELGDFGILVRGGFSRRSALQWNFLSALTFPLGALIAYFAAQQFDVSGLVLFGAGNFIYIAASDLVPEIKANKSFCAAVTHFGLFSAGMALTLFFAVWNA